MPKAPFVLVCVESLCGVFVSGEFVLAHSLDLSALYENRTLPHSRNVCVGGIVQTLPRYAIHSRWGLT